VCDIFDEAGAINMTLKWILKSASVFLLLTSLVQQTSAAETIVGKWAATKAECANRDDRVTVSALGIESSFMICEFDSVKRKANTVKWTGHCFDEGGSRRPEEPDNDGAITATLAAKRLTFYGLGFEVGPLLRCK
jgi:hypothetical protein